MNKNGFAISTLLYGISLMGVMIVILMMSIMSTNRKNTSTMVRDIEEELNRMSLTNTAIDTPGANKPYVVPEEEITLFILSCNINRFIRLNKVAIAIPKDIFISIKENTTPVTKAISPVIK